MSYSTKAEGKADTTEYKVYFEKDGKKVSPFHDIPLFADKDKGIFNMVVEIPRNTKAKLEINKQNSFNPLVQDIKDGKLRYVDYKDGYMWNYGAFPQTWEDPSFLHPDTNAKGDNDPLDVVEIGEHVGKVGEIKHVKPIGVMALIDEGETDWKVIAIDVNDPLAKKVNDIDDLEKEKPGLLHETYVWFRDYKTVVGKPQNKFAYDGKAKNKEFALKIIKENHEFWEKLVKSENKPKGIAFDRASS